MTLTKPDLAGFPVLEGEMDELVEDVFLVFINVEYIRHIRTGQIAVNLTHAM